MLEHAVWVRGVAAAPGGATIITAGGDGAVRLWDLQTRRYRLLEGHIDSVNAIALTPDSRRLVSTGQDGTLRIWDLLAGQSLGALVGHASPAFVDGALVSAKELNAIAVTNDGRFAVSGGGDRTVRIWDLSTAKETRALTGHQDSVRSVSLSSDGRFVVAGSWDESVIVWRLDDGREVTRLASEGLTGCCAFAGPDLVLAGDSSGRLLRFRLERRDLPDV